MCLLYVRTDVSNWPCYIWHKKLSEMNVTFHDGVYDNLLKNSVRKKHK